MTLPPSPPTALSYRIGPHRSRRARWIIATIVAAAVLFAALTWVAGPRLIESWVVARFERAARRLPGVVTLGPVTLHDLTTLEMGWVVWEDRTDWAVRMGPVIVVLDWPAAILGGSPVREARVQGLDVRLGDPQAPFAGLSEAWDRLRGLLGRPGRPDTHSARPWPFVLAQDVTVAAHVARGLSAHLMEARVRLAPPEGSMDIVEVHVDLEGRLRLEDGVERSLKTAARWSPSMGWREADATVTPALSWDGPWGLIRASGVRIRPGELHVLQPSWAPGGTWTIEAEEVLLRTGSQQASAASLAASPAVGSRMPAWLPEFFVDLLGDSRLSEIEVVRPAAVVDVPVPSALAAASSGDSEVTPPRAEGAFRSGLIAVFQNLDRAIERAVDMASSLSTGLPMDSARVHGATVRYRREGRLLPESLAHLDASINRDASSGAVFARLTFECPEAAFGSNQAELSYDSTEREGRLSVALRRLPLKPYAGLMPEWLAVSGDAALAESHIEVRLEEGARRLVATGTLSFDGVDLHLPAVSSVPIRRVDLTVRGRAAVDRPGASVRVEEGLLTFGHVRIPFDFDAERLSSWPRVRLSARIERIRAQDLVASVPDDVIPALKGVRLAGSFAASASIVVDTRDMEALRFDFQPDVADLSILDPGVGVNLDLLRTEFYHRIEGGGGKVIERVVGPSSPSWVPLQEVPRFVVDALTTSEDAQFFRHHGFSLAAIRRSLRVNLERGGFYQGASTLSQQLAKNLFLSPEKTLARKLQEAFITWQLERYLSKEKILELYVNVVEWGPEVFGLREAALHYFGKVPAELDPLEAAYLVSILPNPKGFHRHYESGTVPPAFERRVRTLLHEMAKRGLLSEDEMARLQGRSISFARPNPLPSTVKDERPAPIPDEEFSDDG